MRKTLFVICVVTLLAFSAQAWAHHAFSAEFDANKPVKLRGNIIKIDWINPHAWIHLEVKGASGVAKWEIELGPPNALIKRGWTKTTVPVGTEILVDGYQSKDGALRANGRDVMLPDGRKFFAGENGTGAPGDSLEK
ncbi:MAG TPA: DUF6152 family protein, partial [Terriglobia bacterium]|nr:DUF6152 family protein [Terriglobia bacterium]